jgi:tetratricopeptide (TPR) repeat protein
MPSDRAAKSRLTTWKEVAAFFGKTERTVMRWEAERGLPVRRLPGEARSSIYADVAELEAWLRGPGIGADAPGAALASPAAALDKPQDQVAPHTAMRRRWALAGAATLAIAAVAAARWWPAAPHAAPATAHALYLEGLQHWAQRTPAALNRAADEFMAATRIDPGFAEAYVGLANCYNLQREFAAMPSAQAYMLAKQAAARAIALNPGLAAAHASYAFALFYGDWHFAEAVAEFDRALTLEPDNPAIHHWYGNALMALGQYRAALAHIDRAVELDPASAAIRADRALILFNAGDTPAARTVLEDLTARLPDFLSAHAYLANLAIHTGDDATYLRETGINLRLQPDSRDAAEAASAAAGYRVGGHAGLLQGLLRARLAAFDDGSGSATRVAVTYALLGNGAQAGAYLTRAIDRHDEGAFAYVADARMRALLGDATLAPLRTRLQMPEAVVEARQ